MLDLSAAIEPLRIANDLLGQSAYSWHLVSESGAPVEMSNGIALPVEAGLDESSRNDCLVVCSGETGFLNAGTRSLNWLRFHHRRGGVLAALNTGAFTLARAGLAGSTPLVLHWKWKPLFDEMFPRLTSSDTMYLSDRDVISGAGGSTSLDLMLAVVARDFGEDTALSVADICVHGGEQLKSRVQRQPISRRLGTKHPVLLSVVQRMEATLEDPLPLNELLDCALISRRQVERLFSRHLKKSPSRYYRDLRLERARLLLQSTSMRVIDVAVATGFQSTTNFSKLYRQHFGHAPHRDR